MSKKFYCGNNRLHPGLMNGTHVIATRYQCMKKGFGIGYNKPVDDEYDVEYEPIDNTLIFCGNGDILPSGYDRLGNNGECLRKGFGAGKSKKVAEVKKSSKLGKGRRRASRKNKKSSKKKPVKIRNPVTGKMVLKNGVVGSRIMRSRGYKKVSGKWVKK